MFADVRSVQAKVALVGILIATAWVDPCPSEGRCFQVRALLDQGSTLSFISESLCQTPRTKRQRADLQIDCFGDTYASLARSKVSFLLGPCAKSGLKFTTYVFQGITIYATSHIRFPHSWPHLRNLELADPNPASRQPIHLLTDLYGSLLLSDLRQDSLATSTVRRIAFGWIISSSIRVLLRAARTWHRYHIACRTTTLTHCSVRFGRTRKFLSHGLLGRRTRSVNNVLFRLTLVRPMIDMWCDCRSGRAIHPVNLGDSLPIATKLYARKESRLRSRPEIHEQYNEFLREYCELDHVELVTKGRVSLFKSVCIQHYAMIRNANIAKLRVVFGASSKTRDGTSLGDHLLIGTKL